MAKLPSITELQAIASKERLTMGEKIRILNERLKDAGYVGLGEYVGVHRVTVSGWMRGLKRPNKTQIQKIVDLASPFLTAEEMVNAEVKEPEAVEERPTTKKKKSSGSSKPKLVPEVPKKSRGRPKKQQENRYTVVAEEYGVVEDVAFDW